MSRGGWFFYVSIVVAGIFCLLYQPQNLKTSDYIVKILSDSKQSESWEMLSFDPKLEMKHLQQKRTIIYNRIPKTASDTLRYLLTKVGIKLGHQGLTRFWNKPLNKTDKNLLCKEFERRILRSKTVKKPQVVNGHFYHLDLESECKINREDLKIVLWMNQVRHPVERFISNYFYFRTPSHITFMRTRPKLETLRPTEVRKLW